MKYFKVKPHSNSVQISPSNYLVASELYTEAEIKRMKLSNDFINKHTDPIELSKKGTFFSFGARFMKSNYNFKKAI